MTYPNYYDVSNVSYTYSSPDLLCADDIPCGVSEGEPHEADARRIVIQYKDEFAAWR